MTRHDGWPQFDETEPWHPAFLEDYGPSRDHPGGEYSTTGTGIGSSTRRPNMESVYSGERERRFRSNVNT